MPNSEALEKSIKEAVGKKFVARGDFNTLNAAKKELEEKITLLEEELKAGGDIKKRLEALEKRLAEEKEEQEKKRFQGEREEDMKKRFEAATGERVWRDELTRNAVFREFTAALEREESKDFTDDEILEALVRDNDYFENPNRPKDMRGMGKIKMSRVEDSKMRRIMGLANRD